MKYKTFKNLEAGDCLTNTQEVKIYFDNDEHLSIVQCGDHWIVYQHVFDVGWLTRLEIKRYGGEIILTHMSGRKVTLYKYQTIEFFDLMK